MPKPSIREVHVDRPLTNLSIHMQQEMFNASNRRGLGIARMISPIARVEKESDKFFVFDSGDFLRDEARPRAPGGIVELGGFGLSTDSYNCEQFAIGTPLPWEVRKNSDILSLEAAKLQWLNEKILIKEDVKFSSQIFTTGVWGGGDVSPSTGWSGGGGSPFEDIVGWKRTIRNKIGRDPNRCIMGGNVFDALLNHDDVLARITGGATAASPAAVNLAQLERLFGMEIVVHDAVQNTAAEGQTKSISSIGTADDMLMVYTPDAPSLMTPSAYYMFSYDAFGAMGDGGQVGPNTAAVAISTHESEERMSTIYRAFTNFDFKVTSTEAGLYVDDALS